MDELQVVGDALQNGVKQTVRDIMPTPTYSWDSIDLPTLDSNRPADVLPQIHYFVGGGGPSGEEERICSTADDGTQHSPHIASIFPEGDVEWRRWKSITICGWEPDEGVEIIFSREGIPLKFDRIKYADWWGDLVVIHQFTAEDQSGSYTFEFSGINGTLSHTFNLLPEPPTVYEIYDAGKGYTGELFLSGFQPGETVRVLKYDNHGEQYPGGELSFVGWAAVQVGADGRLTAYTPKSEAYLMVYAAIGEQSGVAKSLKDYETMGLIEASSPATCPTAQPSRLAIGMTARVVADRLIAKLWPGFEDKTDYDTSLSWGRTVIIIGGPVCSDGMLWWHGSIEAETDKDNYQNFNSPWMPEESQGEWFLEPIP